ncbi:MAG: hypothetical protein J6M62_07320 [Selenomonadaceae bacterium]|nr:hypothetical protein [Selenomonadaceae bacterium]
MNIAEILQIPTTKLDFFARSCEVASYIPGRARLYSNELIGNDALSKKIKDALAEFSEITEVSVNTVSGSILIMYDSENLRKNKELKKVEEYIALKARRK